MAIAIDAIFAILFMLLLLGSLGYFSRDFPRWLRPSGSGRAFYCNGHETIKEAAAGYTSAPPHRNASPPSTSNIILSKQIRFLDNCEKRPTRFCAQLSYACNSSVTVRKCGSRSLFSLRKSARVCWGANKIVGDDMTRARRASPANCRRSVQLAPQVVGTVSRAQTH
jgi:hypothetical protein